MYVFNSILYTAEDGLSELEGNSEEYIQNEAQGAKEMQIGGPTTGRVGVPGSQTHI